jgi:hypothetical protein
MPVLAASARRNRPATPDLGVTKAWPVQFMISAMMSPCGVPSARNSRIERPGTVEGECSPPARCMVWWFTGSSLRSM